MVLWGKYRGIPNPILIENLVVPIAPTIPVQTIFSVKNKTFQINIIPKTFVLYARG